ncbi:MAG: glycosyltransferase family 4 protein [Pyrinomonadaceae bacterium]
MKVLIINETGNESRYWIDAILGLKNKNLAISKASIRERGKLDSQLENLGIPTFALNSSSSIDYPKAIARLAKIIASGKYDVIHASEAIPASIAGLACKMVGVKTCIYHRHNVEIEGASGLNILDKIASRSSNLLMAVSHAAAQGARRNNVSKEKIQVAHNGVKPLRPVTSCELSQLRNSLQIPHEAKVILMVSRLRKIKGHEVLINAVKIFESKSPYDIHVVIVGEGEEGKSLRNKAVSNEHTKFHFVGHKEDVAPWFKMADVVAMPSFSEAMPLSAVETISAGKVLIASDVGGIPEIIENGKSGILVPPGDAESLADALLQILNSPNLAKRIGENAENRFFKDFTIEKMIDGWIRCYSHIMHNVGK